MEIKHKEILDSILEKDVSKRKDWEHQFILKYSFDGSVRRYLKSMGDFKEKEDEGKIISHIVMCTDAEFHGIECMQSDNQYGFFKSDVDIRPGHATWVDKDKAEKLYFLFAKEEIEEK